MSDFKFTDFDDEDEDGKTPTPAETEKDDYGDTRITASFPNTNNSFSPLEQQTVRDLMSGGTLAFTDIDDEDTDVVNGENVNCVLVSADAEASLAREKEAEKEIIIGLHRFVVETLQESAEKAAQTGSTKSKVREYTKEAVMPKITFAAPTNQMPFGKKLAIFSIVCVAVGLFFGVEANSYFWYKGAQEGAFGCAFGWITVFDTLPVKLAPIHGEAFGAGFLVGFGILAIIGLFVWLDSDAKRQSRVGHEHGNARLGNKRDFTIFQRKFMD